MKKFSVVLDTNVLISGLIIPKSRPGRIFRLWKHNKIQLITSFPLLKEIEIVLNDPKIKDKYRLKTSSINEFIILLKKRSNLVQHLNLPNIVVRDKEDLLILATAIEGKADYLITGDKDLLTLKNDLYIKELKVVTVNEFLRLFE